MRLISVDPGLNGAIVLWVGSTPTKIIDMPVCQVGSKTVVDWGEVAKIFLEFLPDQTVIEKVGASPGGAASMFSFGLSFGIILGVSAGFGVAPATLTPQKWKSFQGLLKKPKDAARTLAIKRWPEFADQLKYKKNCDRADALLIGDTFFKIGV